MNFIKQSFKLRLMILLSMILVIPCIAIGAFSYQSAKHDVKDQMLKSASENVQILNDSITEYMKAKMQDVDILAKELAASPITSMNGTNVGQDPAVRKQLDLYQNAHSEIELTYIGTDTGLFIGSPADKKNPPDYDPRKRPWYQQAMQNKGNVIITSPYKSQATGNMVVTIAKVTEDGHGVVAINVNLNTIDHMTNKVKIGTTGYIYILDKNSNSIVNPTYKPGEPIHTDWAKATFQSPSGTYLYRFNGQPKEEVFVTNSLTGWKIAGTMFENEFSDAAKSILYNTIVVTLLFMVLAILLVYFITNSTSKAIKQIVRICEKVTEGDLTEIIPVKRQDEIGRLAHRFNQMIESLRLVLAQVDEAAGQLASSSEELTASAEQTSRATEHIATTMQELAAGSDQQASHSNEGSIIITQMYGNVVHISENAQNVTSSANHASEVTQKGNRAIQTANNQMNAINKKVGETAEVVRTLGEYTQQIDKIVEVITGIASQTNLLALNAAIEAARAGEQGRGFAVVADEVRKLAEQSAHSAGQISDFIKKIQAESTNAIQAMDESIHAVTGGIAVVNEAETSFREIQEAIGHVTAQVEEITTAVEMITTSTEGVVHKIVAISELAETGANGVQTVSAASQEQLASMEEITASSDHLSKMAEELKMLTERFKVV
ncbi:methyl-accepting chemotaxis protein [Fodinisporobacter ferrooxydans]|uniref:Methyl-accepting chemotaxis protein n=1 Tax=Fodinisporobacter ferrooxydans TaxID=2901836 RepID=A0ABY4CKZ2_9BACL|nr:methyl-accepting chemotaxis protein [Alicyclobacillaceae bacterium MYW30-H2]